MRMPVAISLALSLGFATAALAAPPEGPPVEAGTLSQIVAKVEARENFKFIDQVDYSNGAYKIVFFMTDGAEVRIEYDAETGEPVAPAAETSAQ